MADDDRMALAYRVLRYTPNLVRDEWLNIGVLLEDPQRKNARARIIEDDSELARVKRLHPDYDEALLRGLPASFETQLSATGAASAWIEKMEQTLSNVLQFSPRTAVLAQDFDAELERLYQEHVALPPKRGRGAALLENSRAWIRSRMGDIFRRHRVWSRMEKNLKVESFTQPGDPMRIDYAYRHNGTRGFVQSLSLARDPSQAKALAYTAECIRARHEHSEFTAITEVPPLPENSRHQFILRLFEEREITLVPLNRAEKFAENLRLRLG